MSVNMSFRLLVQTFSLAVGVSGSCLPQSISEQDRFWVEGQRPIRLLVYNWPSAEAVTSIANILINEVLGIHSVMNERIDTVLEATLKLSGCKDPNCTGISDNAHAALETWQNSADELIDFRRAHPEKAPVDLGTIGYDAEDGLFVSKATVLRAYDETGNSLDFYRSYNRSHHEGVQRYFSSLAELDFDEFVGCNESKWVNPAFINIYVQYTGDLDGVIEVSPGDYHARCEGKFWIAPSCRHNVSECIPIVTSGYGWLLDGSMAWSASYGLPIALGITRTFGSYASSISMSNVMYYWWRPDVTFTHLEPQQVIFPRHNPDAWAQGDKRTATAGSHVGKLVNLQLEAGGVTSRRVHRFLQNLEITLQDIEAVLARVAGGQGIPEATCEWVTSNQAKWERWIPVKTACSPGHGLIDRSLQFVSARSTAVDCSLCLPGHFSELLADDVGRTWRCSACGAGHFQLLAGETSCEKCQAGRFVAEMGQSACALCPLGSYAGSLAMTACEPCGNGTEWTTSRLVQVAGEQRWIETEGATTSDLCSCVEGWYLNENLQGCNKCSSGTRCVGGELHVLPGYFSSPKDPGSVFKCYSPNGRCPGGVPGTCAPGRDTTSLDCGRCLPGLRSKGEAECVPCDGVDYFILALLGFLFIMSSGILHAVSLVASQNKKQTSLINAIVAVNQFVTCLQFLAVMGQVDIAWADPFKTLLRSMDFLSPDFLQEQLDAFNCVTQLSPVMAFLVQNLGVPALFCLAPVLVHFILAFLRKALKLHVLLGTLGLLSVLFVTISCNSILKPFQCEEHPNGLFTMRSNHDVFCNFADVHLQLCILGCILFLFPILFLALCSWILIELPKRLQVADMRFLQACSFLILKFHPGSEIFALVFLVRNMLFAFAPLLPGDATSLLVMQMLICFSFGLVAYFKPWPTRLATCVDLFIHMALLVILILGSFFLEVRNGHAMMVICTAVTLLMMLGILGIAAEGVGRYLLSAFIKPYRFFLCHQKAAAGSLARWLKMELNRRAAGKVFIDSDNLTDLNRLFTIISQDVKTVIIIASPGVLTRKWCLGEMVATRLHNVDAVLVTLPNFVLSDQHLKAFDGMMPELKDLANYGFGATEIGDTLQWLSTIREIPLPSFTLAAFHGVVSELLNLSSASQSENFSSGSNCLILADLEDSEAVATAHILCMLIGPDMMRTYGALPKVLSAGDSIKGSKSMSDFFVMMICTKDCLGSSQMATWLLEALDLSEVHEDQSMQNTMAPQIFVLPLVAEDFQVPSRSSFGDILKSSPLQIDKLRYVQVLQAIFFQIALPFAPKVSSEGDLNVKVKQITTRLRSDQFGSLMSNFALARRSSGMDRSRSSLGFAESTSFSYELCGESTEGTVEWIF